MAIVWVPALVRHLTADHDRVEVTGRTVGEALEGLDRLYPGVRARLCDGNALRPGLAIVIGGALTRDGLQAAIEDGDEVHFVQAIGGGSRDMAANPNELRVIAERAADLVPDGAALGLGTGRAATAFLYALRDRVRAGLRVRGVPTSQESADLADALGIPLTTLDEVDTLDVAIDGADEVDPVGNLIKGYGGALLREKIVAAAARRLVILVGPEKLVPVLGSRGKLPVEVIPFGQAATARRLREIGCDPVVRLAGGEPVLSDNGNPFLDCGIAPVDDPARFEQRLQSIPGIVGTGLFLGYRPTVLIGRGDEVEIREPPEATR